MSKYHNTVDIIFKKLFEKILIELTDPSISKLFLFRLQVLNIFKNCVIKLLKKAGIYLQQFWNNN